jgi:hypothetical protein
MSAASRARAPLCEPVSKGPAAVGAVADRGDKRRKIVALDLPIGP